jgi:hypothetical protein
MFLTGANPGRPAETRLVHRIHNTDEDDELSLLDNKKQSSRLGTNGSQASGTVCGLVCDGPSAVTRRPATDLGLLRGSRRAEPDRSFDATVDMLSPEGIR